MVSRARIAVVGLFIALLAGTGLSRAAPSAPPSGWQLEQVVAGGWLETTGPASTGERLTLQQPTAIALSDTALLIVDRALGSVLGFDLSMGRFTRLDALADCAVAARCMAAAAPAGGWVAATGTGRVWSVDAFGVVRASLDLEAPVSALTIDAETGDVLVLDVRGGRILRLSMQGALVAERMTETRRLVDDAVAGAGRWWVRDGDGDAVVEIDAGSGRVIARHVLPSAFASFAPAPQGTLLFADADDGRLMFMTATGEAAALRDGKSSPRRHAQVVAIGCTASRCAIADGLRGRVELWRKLDALR